MLNCLPVIQQDPVTHILILRWNFFERLRIYF